MKIEIWSDYVCPFCYIGKRKLEKALAQFDYANQVEIVFKAYELNPYASETPDGVGYEGFAKAKNVTIEKARSMMDPIVGVAAQYGLEYHMDKTLTVNTHKAHRLAKWARTFNKEIELSELLMNANFKLCLNLADNEVLLSLVKDIGLDQNLALKVLESDQYSDVVKTEIEEAIQLGVRGVPFFVFNRKYAISGAQPDEQFVLALKKAYEDSVTFEELATDEDQLCGDDGCEI